MLLKTRAHSIYNKHVCTNKSLSNLAHRPHSMADGFPPIATQSNQLEIVMHGRWILSAQPRKFLSQYASERGDMHCTWMSLTARPDRENPLTSNELSQIRMLARSMTVTLLVPWCSRGIPSPCQRESLSHMPLRQGKLGVQPRLVGLCVVSSRHEAS